MAFIEDPGDVLFKSKLDDKSKAKAKCELGEDEKDRRGAVQSFRSLIKQQNVIRTPTDFAFLLRFLRARKFSQLRARDILENYWALKTKNPEWFGNIDPGDTKLQEFLRKGFYYSPMKTDSEGRRIIIERVGNLNVDEIKNYFGLGTAFKNIILVCEWLARDENVQVNGVQVFVDLTGITMGHSTNVMTPENAKRLLQFYQNSLPARMKGFHMYNEPPFIDMLLSIMRPLMKQKLKDRMHFHGKNMANVYDFVDKSVLPDEYLPDDYTGPSAGPEKQIIEDMITDMMKPDFRNYMKDITSDKYGVDLGQAKAQNMHPVSSFRKLNLD